MEVEQLAMESKELDEVPAGYKKEEEVEAEEDQIGDPIEGVWVEGGRQH